MKHIKAAGKIFLSILMCVCVICVYLGTDIYSASALEGEVGDRSLHFIIRHWHDNDLNLNTGDHNLVQGFIVPASRGGGYELQKADGSLMTQDEQDEAHIVFDSGTGTVTVGLDIAETEDGEALEQFVGFTTTAGHEVVKCRYDNDNTGDNTSSVQIQYDANVHLAKVQAFYRATTIATGKIFVGNSNLEKDTEIEGGIKYYNTSAGLHTDKTAEAVAGSDGRTFDLTLESWFAGDNIVDTGLILDASGSMAFTSEETKEVVLTPDQLKALEDAGVRENTALTADQIDGILNPHYTDDELLSYTGYRYFVYDYRTGTEENVPLAYWSGNYRTQKAGNLPSLDTLLGYYPFDGNLENAYTGGSAVMIQQAKDNKNVFSAENTAGGNAQFTSTHKGGSRALDIKKTAENGAVLLDAVPAPDKNGNYSFTISFAIKNLANAANPSTIEPVMELGTTEKNFTSDTYYQVFRDSGGSRNRLRIRENGDSATKTQISDLNSVFSNTGGDWQIITYVVDGTKITTYLNGDDSKSTATNKAFQQQLSTENLGIIIAGLLEGEDIEYDILLDELYVYNSALTSSEVKELYGIISKGQPESQYVALNDAGEDIGIINSKAAFSDPDKAKGWYYVNSQSKWSNYVGVGTEKNFRGVLDDGDKEVTFTDKDSNTVNFTLKEDYGPAIFYYKLDGTGNAVLYCAFNYGDNTSTDRYETSPVYQKADQGRVKVDSLQAALGVFVSELNEAASDNRVSAVRFSLPEGEKHLDELVLLDWTKDPQESANILGLNRGSSSTDYVWSNPSEENETNNFSAIKQYNYGLTGGTHTYIGLQAYLQKLDTRIERSNPDHQKQKKYVVIFTDGRDDDYFDDETNDKRFEAIRLANQLKAKGYSVYCVMLTGGSLNATAADEAEDFLKLLAGEKQAVIPSGNTGTVTKDEETGYVFRASTAEELVEQFSAIVNSIKFSLNDYIVQDYIDPRFDLVDAYGNPIRLNAGGTISAPEKNGTGAVDEKDYVAYTLSKSDSYPVLVSLRSDFGADAQNANLYYDEDYDMYYLRWEDAEIPGCSIGAKELSVWTTRITVRAKDDFLGGNALLSNGNQADMNMVYAMEEELSSDERSSGTDDMYMDGQTGGDGVTDKDAYPSKGFPRTAVNVGTDLSVAGGTQTIYLGESISPKDILEILGKSVDPAACWDYVDRYLKYDDGGWTKEYTSKEALIQALLEEKEVELEYAYLPAVDDGNQTGTKKHEGDVLGTLTFSLEQIIPPSGGTKIPPEGNVRQNLSSCQYALTVSYTPLSTTDREDDNDDLVVEDEYHTPKEAVGTQLGNIQKIGTHTTDIVEGDIHLDIHISREDLEFLKENSDVRKIVYTVEVLRQFGGMTSPEKIGELSATIDLDADWSHTDWTGGYTDIPAEFIMTSEFEDQGWGGYLPIGTYTLGAVEITKPDWLRFKDIEQVTITNDHNALFSRVLAPSQNALDFVAPTYNTNGFYLGTQAGTSNYLNQRLGLLRVELDHDSIEPASFTPIVEKKINGDPPDDKPFQFQISPDSGNPAGAVIQDAESDGSKVFTITGAGFASDLEDLITFTEEGTFTFTITELGNGLPTGYTRDEKTWTLTVTVSEKRFYLAIDSVTYTQMTTGATDDHATFTNEYNATPVAVSATVSKSIPATAPIESFTFSMQAEKDNPEGASLAPGETMTVDVNTYDAAYQGTAGFDAVTFTKAGIYKFTITEVNSGKPGWTYDNSTIWTLQVTVRDVDAILYADVLYTDQGGATAETAKFINEYDPTLVRYAPVVRKQIQGSPVPTAEPFTFTIQPETPGAAGVEMPSNTEVTRLGAGTAAFQEITFTQAGTYRFVIREEKGTTRGYTYDETPWILEVTVTDDGGALGLTTQYFIEGTADVMDAAVFKNTYRVESASYVPKVQKTILGDAPGQAEFTFMLAEREGNPTDGVILPTDLTTTITGTGSGTFEALQFVKAGTYSFAIREENSGIPGYIYDDSIYLLTVTLEDRNAKLQVTDVEYKKVGSVSEKECAEFENSYRPEAVSFAPIVEKKISGDARGQEDTFLFRLTGTDTEGIQLPFSDLAAVEGEGKASFGDIIFTKAGTYYLTIQERNDGITGYTYDDSVWTVTVTVTDVDAVLVVSEVAYTKEGMESDKAATFENRYLGIEVPPSTGETSDYTSKINTGEPSDPASPETGDTAKIWLWMLGGVGSLAAGIFLILFPIKEKRNGLKYRQ